MRNLITIFAFLLIASSSTNAQWVQKSSGLGNVFQVTSLVSNGTNIFAGTYGNGIFLTTNNGDNWMNVNTGLTSLYVNALLSNGIYLYAGTTTGVFRSSNNGTNWTQTNNGVTPREVKSLLLSGTDIYAGLGGAYGIYRSTNNGNNWTSNGLLGKSVFALLANGANIFAGTGGDGIFVSSNSGANWTSVSTSIFAKALTSIGNNIFAGSGSGGGVFVSTNNGGSWTSVNTGLPYLYVLCFATYGTDLFVGLSGYGVYLTKNNGLNWINRNQGFSQTSIPSPGCFAISNNYIFIGAYSKIWRRNYSDIISVKQISEFIPSDYSLKQNYPNPFNPTTNIKFDLPKNTFVKLVIYDILGKEIETLVNDKLNAGSYNVDWNATNYTSGVYFYRIETESFTDVKRMLLVK